MSWPQPTSLAWLLQQILHWWSVLERPGASWSVLEHPGASWSMWPLAHSWAWSRNPRQKSSLILIWPLTKLFKFVPHIYWCTNNGLTKSLNTSINTYTITFVFNSNELHHTFNTVFSDSSHFLPVFSSLHITRWTPMYIYTSTTLPIWLVFIKNTDKISGIHTCIQKWFVFTGIVSIYI